MGGLNVPRRLTNSFDENRNVGVNLAERATVPPHEKNSQCTPDEPTSIPRTHLFEVVAVASVAHASSS